MEYWRFSAAAVLKEKNYQQSDSWTSIGDIGRIYNGRKFTYEDYYQTEQAYVKLLVAIFQYLHARKIKLIQLEVYKDLPPKTTYDKSGELRKWHKKVNNNMSLSLEDLHYIVPLILRENMWGTLYHKRSRTYIHFGYDYYVYINSPKLFQYVDGKDLYNPHFVEMVHQNGLYLE